MLTNDEEKAQWLTCLGAAATMMADGTSARNLATSLADLEAVEIYMKRYAQGATLVADRFFEEFKKRCQ